MMYASQRARSLSSCAELMVDRDDDKNPVVALREIADDKLDIEEIEGSLVRGMQKHIQSDEPDEEEMDLLTDGQDFGEALNQESAPSLNSPLDSEYGDTKRAMPIFDDDVLPVDNNTLPSTD